jgi:hypothetical protein
LADFALDALCCLASSKDWSSWRYEKAASQSKNVARPRIEHKSCGVRCAFGMCEPVHNLGGATGAILAQRPSKLRRRRSRHATMQAIDGHMGGYFSGISDLTDDGAKCCASGSLPKLPPCVRNHRCQIQANRRRDHFGVPDLQDCHDREFQQTRIEG